MRVSDEVIRALVAARALQGLWQEETEDFTSYYLRALEALQLWPTPFSDIMQMGFTCSGLKPEVKKFVISFCDGELSTMGAL